MYLARPTFRPWPTVFAILLAWPLAGAIYMLPLSVRILGDMGGRPLWERIVVAAMEPPLGTIMTVVDGGYPYMSEQDANRTNQYPVIFPVMAVLVTLASGLVRFGRQKPT